MGEPANLGDDYGGIPEEIIAFDLIQL